MKTEGLKCHRCGHELEVTDVQNFDDERGEYTYLHCPYCGADYEIDEPTEEEKMEFDFYKDGEDVDERFDGIDTMNEHCLNCGHKIYVGSNFMLSDYDESVKDIDDDKMNFCMNTCEHCGCTEVRWDNSENEKKDYPYWKEDNDLYVQLKDRTLEYVVHVWAKSNSKSFKEMVDKFKNIKDYFETLIQMEESMKHD